MKRSTIIKLAYVAARSSCFSFLLALACILIALVVRPLALIAVGALLFPLVGFFSGATTLLSATKARVQDISAAFAGMTLNILLLFGIFYCTFLAPCHRCSPGPACHANLKQIDGAKAAWSLEKQKATNDVPVDSDLFGDDAYIRRKPVCPEGGIYRLGRVCDKAVCSTPGHTFP
jgi:hypothetical protein